MSADVHLLLGRPPGPASVLSDVTARLRSAGLVVQMTVVDDRVPPAAYDAGLLVLKDLPAALLPQLVGLPCCNSAESALVASDKAHVLGALVAAGVPAPRSAVVQDWAQVQARCAGRPTVVKPRVGEQGRGVLLLDGEAPHTAPAPGPWLVQDRVSSDGLDRKLYVVGEDVAAVLRRWPAPADRNGDVISASSALQELGRAAAAAVGLEIAGVDVLVGPDGPVVVDVNAFPGFKGVPGAAARLADHLLARVHDPEVVPCASS